MTGSRALLLALGIDSVGNGIFLPVSVLYLTAVIGLDVPTAGVVSAAAIALGLLVPPFAGQLVDRWGPHRVLVLAQFVQAAGAALYLVATTVPEAALAASLLAIGQRGFYCSVFVLIADVAAEGAKDKPFALAGLTQSVCFGAGAAVAGLLVGTDGVWAYRLVAGLNVVSFLACAVILLRFVRPPHHQPSTPEHGGYRRLLTDWPFVGLIAVNFCFAVAVDMAVVGVPVHITHALAAPAWLIGVVVGLVTMLRLAFQVPVVQRIGHLPRTTALLGAGGLMISWALALAFAVLLPPVWAAAWVVLVTTLYAFGAAVHAPLSNALADASAPPENRGRYLAVFQYSFGLSNVVAPALLALTAYGAATPWLVLAVLMALGSAALPVLGRTLPKVAVHR
ncbi:MFS family permease [Crossiella equi]|uniref:MFS family permease n=1 Tax=Crossiella equi TaxID=130796 RepID=A0ABS5A4E9_9PSEU|nr:MFS transporter [Crossiella equi]MBP2471418.1 MFS family permease [Crossiella equi]